jgi:hypothetical protein
MIAIGPAGFAPRVHVANAKQECRYEREVIPSIAHSTDDPPRAGWLAGHAGDDVAAETGEAPNEEYAVHSIEHELLDEAGPTKNQKANRQHHADNAQVMGQTEGFLQDGAGRGRDHRQHEEKLSDVERFVEKPAPAEQVLEEAAIVVTPEQPRELEARGAYRAPDRGGH